MITVAILSLSFALKAQIEQASPNFECSILDDNGNVWLGTRGAGLWRIQGNSIEFYSNLGQHAVSDIYSMTLDRQGHLWLTTDRGLLEYDYEKWTADNLTSEGGESVSNISKLGQSNQIAVGISVNYMDQALLALKHKKLGMTSLGYYDRFKFKKLIYDFPVNEIFEDLDAIIWMSNGGFKMENGKLKVVVQLPFGIITSAIQDKEGDVWLGIDGPGLFRYDGKDLRYYGEEYGFEGLSVNCLHEDLNGRIWMATKNVKNQQDQGVSCFDSGLFHHLQETATCPVRRVNTISSDKKGNVWFAGDNGSLVKFNGRNFSTFTLNHTQIN
jgi:ligand-binding sensor domain-containing protein